MTALGTMRLDVAGRVRARLEEAERLEPVVLDVRDASPPCALIGLANVDYQAGRVTLPVQLLAPGPGHGDAIAWLEDCLEAVTRAGPLGPYRAVDATAVLVDVGDRTFPAYTLAYSIPVPPTYCRP